MTTGLKPWVLVLLPFLAGCVTAATTALSTVYPYQPPKEHDLSLSPQVARAMQGMPDVGSLFSARAVGTGPVGITLTSDTYTGCAVLPEFNWYAGLAWDLSQAGSRGGDEYTQMAYKWSSLRRANTLEEFLTAKGHTPTLQTSLDGDATLVSTLTQGKGVSVKVVGYLPQPNTKLFLQPGEKNFRKDAPVCLAVKITTATGNDLAELMAAEGAGVACQKGTGREAHTTPFAEAYAAGSEKRAERLTVWEDEMRPVVNQLGVNGLVINAKKMAEIGAKRMGSGTPANLDMAAKFASMHPTPKHLVSAALLVWTEEDTNQAIRDMRTGLQHTDGCRSVITKSPTPLFIPKSMVTQ